jgi:hypothetical protein
LVDVDQRPAAQSFLATERNRKEGRGLTVACREDAEEERRVRQRRDATRPADERPTSTRTTACTAPGDGTGSDGLELDDGQLLPSVAVVQRPGRCCRD